MKKGIDNFKNNNTNKEHFKQIQEEFNEATVKLKTT